MERSEEEDMPNGTLKRDMVGEGETENKRDGDESERGIDGVDSEIRPRFYPRP